MAHGDYQHDNPVLLNLTGFCNPELCIAKGPSGNGANALPKLLGSSEVAILVSHKIEDLSLNAFVETA